MWQIKDTVTNEVIFSHESVHDIHRYLSDEITTMNRNLIKIKEYSKIREYLLEIKKKYRNAIVINEATKEQRISAWEYISSILINDFIEFRSQSTIKATPRMPVVKILLRRMPHIFQDKDYIILKKRDDLKKIRDFGIEFTQAKIYDSNLREEEIIMTVDQINYLKLLDDKENSMILTHCEAHEIYNLFAAQGYLEFYS